MKLVYHEAASRGFANHGWLQANHSFSFDNFYSAEKMNFGTLRVLNDDLIAPGMGFGTHPHDNMEIITIPLSGLLKHKDSMGNKWEEVKAGEVQVMSTGSGIQHSRKKHLWRAFKRMLPFKYLKVDNTPIRDCLLLNSSAVSTKLKLESKPSISEFVSVKFPKTFNEKAVLNL